MSETYKQTPEQEYALELAESGVSMKISAYAGAGKTTTLRSVGRALSNKTGVYLAFNKSIAQEASTKFGSNITCKTFHGLALSSCPRWLIEKLNYPRTTSYAVSKKLELIGVQLPVRDDKRLRENDTKRFVSAADQASIVINSIALFCRSNDTSVRFKHIIAALPDWVDTSAIATIATVLADKARFFWEDITSPQGVFKVEHDYYFKYWTLNNPIIPGDFLLCDESQDIDNVAMGALNQQTSQLIYVGDKHQSIYRFRGAINPMQHLDIPEARLSQSFRFGDEIAKVANVFLRFLLDEKLPLRGLSSIDSKLCDLSTSADAYLCRKNASALELLMTLSRQGRKPKLEVDTKALMQQIKDADELMNGICVKLPKNSSFSGFVSWQEVMNYVELVPTSDITPVVKMIEEHGTTFLQNAVSLTCEDTSHDCIISTSHKSKGLEYDSVYINNDYFINIDPSKPRKKPLTNDESRLLYVAVTRAKYQLDINNLKPLLNFLIDPNRKGFDKTTGGDD